MLDPKQNNFRITLNNGYLNVGRNYILATELIIFIDYDSTGLTLLTGVAYALSNININNKS